MQHLNLGSKKILCTKCRKVIVEQGVNTNIYVCTKCSSPFCGNSCGQSRCTVCRDSAPTEKRHVHG